MTIKVEMLGGNMPPELADAMRKLFGAEVGGDDARKLREEQRKLKAAGWTADDICQLNGAMQLVREEGPPVMKGLLHACVAHHQLPAARAAKALGEWAVHCCAGIDRGAVITGGSITTDGCREFWQQTLERAVSEVQRLEQAEELRRSVETAH